MCIGCRLFYSLLFTCCRLTEAELRYKTRDSRPEDLDRIRELRMAVGDQEKRIEELLVRLSLFFNS